MKAILDSFPPLACSRRGDGHQIIHVLLFLSNAERAVPFVKYVYLRKIKSDVSVDYWTFVY